MNESVVYFKMKNESQTNKIQIQGVSIQIKDLRQKIKDWLRMSQQGNDNMFNTEELLILGEQEEGERALCLADKVRQKQTVVIVRQPAHTVHSLCRSCFFSKQQSSTPCCLQPICTNCETQFIRVEKCFFNMNSQCPFKYHNYPQQPVFRCATEVSNVELEHFLKGAVFFIVKSNNELNVNLAKKHHVWATTRRNFGTLQAEFNNRHKVVLIFTANRVERFLGCARMVNTLVQRDSKWSWHATSSIQLADNFQIDWLRKGMVDFSKMQDTINPKTGELVIRSKDCQEVPADIGQRICLLFEQIKNDDEELPDLPKPETILPIPEPIQQDEWELDKIIRIYPSYYKNIANVVSEQKQPSPIKEPSVMSRESSSSPEKELPKQTEPNNMAQMALINSLYRPMAMQQQMEADWMNMNKGKIPGLTGKVQYPHPFIQRFAHKQSKAIEAFFATFGTNNNNNKDDNSKRNRSSSKSEKDRRRRKHRSESDEKRKSHKKNKDHKKEKKSKNKKRSRSRDHKKSKKH